MKSKRDKIIYTAARLFVDQGFHGTSTAQIAKEANVATGTLFHHFKSKEELINAIYIQFKKDLIPEISNGIEDAIGCKTKFQKVFLNGMKHGIRNPYIHRFFMMYSQSPFILQISRDEATEQWQFYKDIINTGIREGIIKDFDSELLQEMIVSNSYALLNHLWRHPEKQGDESFLLKGFQIVWDSIKS